MGLIRGDWVNALVTVENPNGSHWLCLDTKDLNAHLKREEYHLPHKSANVADMERTQFFSKLGFYQMQLGEVSTM